MIVSPESVQFKKPCGFIVLDGVNGAGKSTLQRSIAAYLEGHHVPTLLTREPGATEVGKHLRALILEPRAEPLSPTAELLLFAADRAEHVAKVIQPALAANKVVVSDRYYYSTVAFQGYGRNLDRYIIDSLNAIAVRGTLPDLVLVLDLDPLEGLRRAQNRSTADTPHEHDNFEQEELAFHTRLRKGFLELAEALPEQFIIVDANPPPEKVFAAVIPALDRLISAR